MEYATTSAGAVTALGIGISILSLGIRATQKGYNQRPRLKVVHNGTGFGKATVDIVCVHGLGGHPKKTWTSPENSVNWLTDILPDDLREHASINARIMTYDYHAEPRLIASFPSFLHRQSRQLVSQLAERREQGTRDRPLVFIAHSLGGLIVKDALVYCSASEVDHDTRLKSIQLSTVGVLFFGTPNRDGQRLQWSKLINQVMSTSGAGVTPSGLDPLLRQEELFKLELDRYKSIEDRFRNVSFYETIRTTIGRDKEEIHVVPQVLTLPLHDFDWWESHGLNRTHQDLCKFGSRDDEDYQLVSKALHGCLKASNKAATHLTESDEKRRGEGRIAAVSEEKEDEVTPMIWRVQSFPARSIRRDYSATTSKLDTLEKQLQELSFSAKQFDRVALEVGIQLIEMYDDMRELSKAEMLYNRLKKMTKNQLDELEAEYGYRDRRPLRLAADLARLYAAAGYPSKSECLNRRLLVAVQDVYRYNSLPSAFVLGQLAHNAHTQGDYDRAVSLLKRVHTIQIAHYDDGDKNPEALRTTARLAIIYDQQKKYKEAQKLYHQVIKYREEPHSLGPLHPETLKAMENLALSYRLQGKKTLPKAVTTYEEVLERRKQVLSRCPKPETVDGDLRDMTDKATNLYHETMSKLLDVLREQGESAKASAVEEEWASMQQKSNLGSALFDLSAETNVSDEVIVKSRSTAVPQDGSDKVQFSIASTDGREGPLRGGPSHTVSWEQDDVGNDVDDEDAIEHGFGRRDSALDVTFAGAGIPETEGSMTSLVGAQFRAPRRNESRVRFDV